MPKTDKSDRKRRLSSDGNTPKPSTKTVKMADTNLEDMVDKITVIAEAVQKLQCRSMRDNLLFFGLAEYKGNRKEDCVRLIDDFCDDLLRLRNVKQDIERAHRIGRRRNGECRPVVVKFSSFRAREKVRANAGKLVDTRYAIQEQFPRVIQEQRKQLYPILKEARNRGKKATLVVNRLYIDGEEYTGPETLEAMETTNRENHDETVG
ncbi:uncharacterized protein LOC134244373 [Saccostrea cucullata]|uniref:uncharacterized protein LOC134244373 n=1 Tax=Saccostrea cuccullata TaxID=36930 RepID=UPI002ED380F3